MVGLGKLITAGIIHVSGRTMGSGCSIVIKLASSNYEHIYEYQGLEAHQNTNRVVFEKVGLVRWFYSNVCIYIYIYMSFRSLNMLG